mgnify:CR=1 FL=1
MSTLYLLNYNNYYNRIVKTTTLSNYKDNAYLLYTKTDYNFKPMDSCYTDIILNISDTLNPDYLVVTETSNGTESIASRWFILESSRTRGGQYKMRLRRDVFADYKSIVKAATIYCEKDTHKGIIIGKKGDMLKRISTKARYDMELLKDETCSAWIIGYLDNKAFEGVSPTLDVPMNVNPPAWSKSYTSIAAAQTDFPRTSTATNYFVGKAQDVQLRWYMKSPADVYTRFDVTPNNTSWQLAATTSGAGTFTDIDLYVAHVNSMPKTADQWNSAMDTDLGAYTSDYEKLMNAAGTIIKVGSSPAKYYKLNVLTKSTATTATITENTYNEIYDIIQAINSLIFTPISAPPTGNMFARYNKIEIAGVWEDITDSFTVSIANTVPLNPTAPYYMFAMPYHSCKFQYKDSNDDTHVVTSNPGYTMQFVQQLIKTVVQLLPYFPDRYFQNAGVILLDDTDQNSVTYIEDAQGMQSFLYWGAPQSFRFDLGAGAGYTIAELSSRKVDNETRFCRISAPNYSASFDFSIAKNRGVSGFRVFCTYRPYQPHIQIMPLWKGVYGQNFADARGLICGGDYSVDIVNDAWTEYQINNKNYQLIFDRQILSMDRQHEVQQMNDIFGAVSNTVSAAASGATAFSGLGPAGTLLGGLIAGGMSAVGGAMDITNNQKLRADQRSAAFDMFKYNLGNIQARPTTITKLSALAGNNKIWPFYEIYETTSREVALLEAQLQYAGMTINAIGTVEQYIGPSRTFVRGKLIRITGLEHDAEMSQLVADELARGIYIT